MISGLTINELCFLQNGPYSLVIEAGGCIGLTGMSGVGKTQFLRAVADIIPHSGRFVLDGVNCGEMSACEWRRRVSLFPAESRWWYDLVGDHFPQDYGARLRGDWLAELGFTDDVMGWRVSRLSTGEKQRLAFMRSMINQPSVLLLDEPTSALDKHYSMKLEKIILDLRQQHHVGVVWISHDQEQLQRVGDRIYRFEKQGLQGLD